MQKQETHSAFLYTTSGLLGNVEQFREAGSSSHPGLNGPDLAVAVVGDLIRAHFPQHLFQVGDPDPVENG